MKRRIAINREGELSRAAVDLVIDSRFVHGVENLQKYVEIFGIMIKERLDNFQSWGLGLSGCLSLIL
jgi:hypothetical protein